MSDLDKLVLLDPAAAAELLGVVKASLATWRTQGNGPSYVKVGRLIRYRPEDLRAWVETRTASKTSGRRSR